jgi:hypothetical protein
VTKQKRFELTAGSGQRLGCNDVVGNIQRFTIPFRIACKLSVFDVF